MSDLLLAGDVGGTNTRLRLVDAANARSVLKERIYSDQPVETALSTFIEEIDANVRAACLGCAGRIVEGDVRMTNRPGESITDESVSAALKLPKNRVRLVNDMVAHISGVDDSETIEIRAGRGEGDVEGIVMPGTGLGTGMRVRTPTHWIPLPSEGGHLDYGPPSPDLAFLRDVWLSLKGGRRVSWENLCSGPGLPVIYAGILNPQRPGDIELPHPKHITSVVAGGETGGVDPQAARMAVRILITLTGARAGNLCLGVLATRGMTFGGSILNDIYNVEPQFVTDTLLNAFDACGPEVLRSTLTDTPIRLLRSPDSGMIGAAALARELV